MAMSLERKVAIVTGATSGIGRATAVLFAKERAKVVLAARRISEGETVAKEIQAAGGTALFVRADVSRAEEVKALIVQTVSKYGRLDCAVNNAAAIWNEQKRTGDFAEQDFDREVNGNLRSVWLCLRSELEQMRRQEYPGGTIVNVSSVNGLGAAPGAAFYSMAKAGILALTKATAMEFSQLLARQASLGTALQKRRDGFVLLRLFSSVDELVSQAARTMARTGPADRPG
jgi:NAD(P)-dependent dehydrogenase (short-subunit alcohol dehydrogenase family)